MNHSSSPPVPGLSASRVPTRLRLLMLSLCATLSTGRATAGFHLWNIREIYTDSSGSLQFIELYTAFDGENFMGGQQISVMNAGRTMTHVFTVPNNLTGSTANRALLFGTAGLQAAGGPAPDFIIPDSFLFAGGGNISFFGANSGFYTALPTDGVNSRLWGGGNAVNSPQNFAGQAGHVSPPVIVPSEFVVASSVIAAGGGPGSGGGFSVNGTVGQPAVGATSGGAFTVTSGFWSGFTSSIAPIAPALSIRFGSPVNGIRTVVLSWPNPSTGYVLEQSADMSAPGGGWVDVTQTPVVNGANKEVTLLATGQFCLFRLRKL